MCFLLLKISQRDHPCVDTVVSLRHERKIKPALECSNGREEVKTLKNVREGENSG